jgi:hypothetical protein
MSSVRWNRAEVIMISAKGNHELNNGPDREFHKSSPRPQANGETASFAASKSATQNRDGAAIQAKLELIRVSAARNLLIGIETLTQDEMKKYALRVLQMRFAQVTARRRKRTGSSTWRPVEHSPKSTSAQSMPRNGPTGWSGVKDRLPAQAASTATLIIYSINHNAWAGLATKGVTVPRMYNDRTTGYSYVGLRLKSCRRRYGEIFRGSE